MPRRTRMYLPGYTYHIVQRGNNRKPCFFEEQNYQTYLDFLEEAISRYEVSLHAYCLMTNHVHLLMTPSTETGISNAMKLVCSRYAQNVNKRYSRTGTLWEGRHKACPVDSEAYLLRCYRYIELNPVTACIVDKPEDYPWSSYRANTCKSPSVFLSAHDCFVRLGTTEQQRCESYLQLVRQALSLRERAEIKKAIHYSMPLGSEKFQQEVELKTGKKIGYAAMGRPKSN